MTEAAATSRKLSALANWRDYIIYIGFVVIFLVFAATLGEKGFLDPNNLLNIIRQTAIIAVMSVTMTFVLSTGEIDLSVGAVAGLASVATAMGIDQFGLPGGILCGLGTGVIVGAVNGYCLTFWRFRGANLMFGIMLFGIFIPYQIFVFPMISISASFGLYATLPGIVLIHVVFGMPIMTLMFRNFFATIPVDLFNAARVDGAGFFRILREIILPISTPIIVVAVIWQATASWNDYLLGLVFAGREHLPMTAQLNLLVSAEMGAHEYNVDMAATLQTALVPLVIYFVSGKWFARGIAAGAVKG